MIDNVKYLQIYLIFACALILFSCKQSNRPDVSKIDVNIRIKRFDKDLFEGKAKGSLKTHQLLKAYGSFYEDYVNRIVGNYNYNGQEVLQLLYDDPAYTDLQQEVDSVFKDISGIEHDLTETFRYVKYYYPKAWIPTFVTFTSGFEVQTPIGDDYIGIGLDMFLGKDNKFYKAIVQSVPVYLSRRFSPEYVVPRVTETYLREELLPERDDDRSLLSKMIYNGKILYCMDNLLKEELEDSVKIGYTTKQLNWCRAFEKEIWAYYLENNLLFETDHQKIQVLLSEGPFTPGLGENNQSAPKIGVWTGWQIVRKYMKQNPDIALQDLMAEQDEQKILTLSKYKP